jgi:hypothetical protein
MADDPANNTGKYLLIIISFFFISVVAIFFSCKKEYSCEGCAEKNKPPIANAGRDTIIVLPVDSVKLDGSLSSDPDGTITSFLWTKISGPASFTINNISVTRTVVKHLAVGSYQFELKVTDNGGLSAKDTVRIVVDSVVITNHPPIANAGHDTTITLPANTFNLDGSGSTDPENNITNYLWTKISGPLLFNITSSTAVQTQVTNLVQGTYEFELKVTDARGLFSKDTMQVIINPIVSNNIPPVAKAGNDTTIQSNQTSCAPTSFTFTLNGNNSYDPDGNIMSYLWIGPGTIANPNSIITTVTGAFQGTVSFILKVTDNKGAFAYDTIHISIVPANRLLVPAQLTPIGTLSQTRSDVSVGSAGNKILFAGGSPGGCATATVDIYDVATGSWSISQLSQARFGIGVSTLGNKIFFAGGIVPLPGPPGPGCYITNMIDTRTAVVDIYDVSTNTWSTSQLSSPRVVTGSVTSNKAVFAGNEQLVWTTNDRADIYDGGTNSWSIGSLSFTRHILAATVIGNKCFFAGGEYDPDGLTSNIDIYDASSNTWTVDYFSPPFNQGWAPSGIAVGNKNYWAGGWYHDAAVYMDVTNHVEIRDEVTHSSTFDCLFEAKSHFDIVQKNNKIVFFTDPGFMGSGNKFDIYDTTTGTWSIGVMTQDIRGASIISVNNTIYVAGGYVNGVLSNQVWKLEF